VLGLFVFFANGMGLFSIASRSVVIWAALEVGAALVLAPLWGFSGIAAASALAVWGPTVWLARQLHTQLSARAERVRFGEVVGKPVVVGGVVGGLLHAISPYLTDLRTLLLAAALGTTVYALALWKWSDGLRQLIRHLWMQWWGSAKVFSSATLRNTPLP
jgi:peptidoglycan biosynthesis protein MviN/MurJ (putative lipid II flippase)